MPGAVRLTSTPADARRQVRCRVPPPVRQQEPPDHVEVHSRGASGREFDMVANRAGGAGGSRIDPSRRTESDNGYESIQRRDASALERLNAVPLKFLRFNAVRDRTGLSRSTIWRLERRDQFPK